MFNPDQAPKINTNIQEYNTKRTEELRKHILDTYVKPEEYYKKGEEARRISAKGFGRGVYLKGELIGYNPQQKAHDALLNLSDSTREKVMAHGIASNIPLDLTEEQKKKFPLFALLQIMATGEVKGDWGTLKVADDSPGGRVFDTAPFILLSNKGEPLAENNKEGISMLKNLRTVLVNGQYESMVDDLRKRFPGVSFRTTEEIDDTVFEKKSEPFKSFEDQIQEKIKEELKRKKY